MTPHETRLRAAEGALDTLGVGPDTVDALKDATAAELRAAWDDYDCRPETADERARATRAVGASMLQKCVQYAQSGARGTDGTTVAGAAELLDEMEGGGSKARSNLLFVLGATPNPPPGVWHLTEAVLAANYQRAPEGDDGA